MSKYFESFPKPQGTGAKKATKVVALTKQLREIKAGDEPLHAFVTEIDGEKVVVVKKVTK